MENKVIVKVINKSKNALPKYETANAAGLDLRADFSRVSPENPIKTFGDSEIIFAGEAHETTMLRLDPGARALVPTGLKIALPEGYEAQVRPRSGLALKQGITVLNTPGTIDADYRGEIGIILINLGLETVWIEDGERVAQLVLARYGNIDWEVTNNLDETERGEGGFNSTGVK